MSWLSRTQATQNKWESLYRRSPTKRVCIEGQSWHLLLSLLLADCVTLIYSLHPSEPPKSLNSNGKSVVIIETPVFRDCASPGVLDLRLWLDSDSLLPCSQEDILLILFICNWKALRLKMKSGGFLLTAGCVLQGCVPSCIPVHQHPND